ncbi:MAG TPA: hypothetical protein VNO70_24125 [Blastocatellia bacterium]|nr:hypothetical protein [Blastocatellia bacterium]
MYKSVTAIFLALLMLCPAFGNSAAYAARPAAPATQTADALLQMLPDCDGFIAVDFARVSGQIQSLTAQRADLTAKLRTQLNRMASLAGVPLESASQVVLSFSASNAPQRSQLVILLSGAFNQEEILARLAQESGKTWKAKKYKGQRIYVDPAKSKPKNARTSIAFFDNQTVVAFGPNRDVKRVIDVRAGAQSGASQNAALMAAYQQTDASASIRFAFLVPEALRQWLATATGQAALLRPLAAVTQVSGTIDLNESGLTALVSLLTGTPDEAAAVVNLINMGLVMVKLALGDSPEAELLLAILNGVSAMQAGNVANVTVNVPAELIQRLIEKYGSRAPRG